MGVQQALWVSTLGRFMGNFRDDGEVKRGEGDVDLWNVSFGSVCMLQSPSPFLRSVKNVCVLVCTGVFQLCGEAWSDVGPLSVAVAILHILCTALHYISCKHFLHIPTLAMTNNFTDSLWQPIKDMLLLITCLCATV